ncbi:MAG TPA: protease pro-enzyme activation domain-containing protein, partial [Burkholderiaceae bacterium]|nr:protease pro-enzyme activation domain-containing protein [Burkholderiaceae bacterium]
MMKKIGRVAVAAALTYAVSSSMMQAGAATPSLAQPQDLGPTSATATQTVSIVLKIQNQAQLEQYVAGTVDPFSDNYQQFLTSKQFLHYFAPSNSQMQFVLNALKSQGLVVNDVAPNNLLIHATGTTAQFNQLLQMEVHDYYDGQKYYHRPRNKGVVPQTLADMILVIAGLNTQPNAKSRIRRVPETTASIGALDTTQVSLPKSATTTGTPGKFTVADVANMYNINPLYQNNITGRGRTIGIVTLATFTPDDAYFYWNSLGLKVSPNRITQVHVDGGAGTEGADETTLDVEQSGGVAPGAKIVVYDAPNTDAGFIDVFYKAISDNIADTLSVSWGGPEIAQSSDVMTAQHQAFIVAAAQGISVFAAAGDAGAYDINDQNNAYTYPACTKTLTVDSPASDPYVTAAGGTTIPNVQVHKYGTVTVTTERPWGWDYLQDYIVTNYGQALYDANYFPVGDGGGVSVTYGVPLYQQFTKGVQTSAVGQSLICQTPTGPQNLITLPDGYAG